MLSAMTPYLLLALGMAIVLGGVIWLRLHPFLALTVGAFAIALATPRGTLEQFAENHSAAQIEAGKMKPDEAAVLTRKLPGTPAAKRVVAEFGKGCAKVGLVVAFAALIGKCLLDSGAAARVVAVMLALFGPRRAGLAFLVSGFVLAVPVFFDTVFLLLVPLAVEAARREGDGGKNYLFYVLCIVAGGTMAHSLVPPTPGPLFVAEELGVGIGAMMAGGLAVGACSAAFGYCYARRAAARFELAPPAGDPASALDDKDLPPAFWSFLPVLLPVALVGAGTVYSTWKPDGWAWLAVTGDKNVALGLSAAVSFALLAKSCRGDRERLRAASAEGLSSGAMIVLITAAGSAFGGVLAQTDIATAIGGMGGSAALALPVCFSITALVRTAQGSATVAMITAAPVAAAFAAGGGLGFHPVYLALAVGCGSKPIPWMNDSGFWVVTKMAGLREDQTLRTVTPMMSLMGVVGLLATMLGAWLLPCA